MLVVPMDINVGCAHGHKCWLCPLHKDDINVGCAHYIRMT